MARSKATDRPVWPAGEIAAVEGVGFFGGGEAGVLADGPGTAGVHRGARTAHERRHAGQRADVLEAFQVLGGVQRLDGNALGRVDREGVQRFVLAFFLGERGPVVQSFLGKISHVQAQIDKPLMINDFVPAGAYHLGCRPCPCRGDQVPVTLIPVGARTFLLQDSEIR